MARVSASLLGLLVAIFAIVSAQTTDCNPSFNVTAGPDCIENCNKKAGQELWSDWTNDRSSPNFIKSLSYLCGKGTPQYTAFMTSAGVCMMSCSTSEQDDFSNREYGQVCAWYNEHKNDTCNSTTASNASDTGTQGSSAMRLQPRQEWLVVLFGAAAFTCILI